MAVLLLLGCDAPPRGDAGGSADRGPQAGGGAPEAEATLSTAPDTAAGAASGRDTTRMPSVDARARLLLDRALLATGGFRTWADARTLIRRVEPAEPSDSVAAATTDVLAFPDRMVRRIAGEEGEQLVVIGPDGVRIAGPAGVTTPDAAVGRRLRAWLERELPVVLHGAAVGRIGARYLGPVGPGGRFSAVEISPPHGLPSFRYIIETESGRPVGREYAVEGASVEETFVEYEEQGGLFLPGRIRTRRSGQLVEDNRVVERRLNGPVPDWARSRSGG